MGSGLIQCDAPCQPPEVLQARSVLPQGTTLCSWPHGGNDAAGHPCEDRTCRLIQSAVEQWGTVDILVNNAGITRDTLMMRMKPDQWNAVINTNLSGVFYATQVRPGR